MNEVVTNDAGGAAAEEVGAGGLAGALAARSPAARTSVVGARAARSAGANGCGGFEHVQAGEPGDWRSADALLALKEALKAEFGDLGGGESDDETFLGVVEASDELRLVVAALVRSSLEDEVWARALRLRIDEMRERLARFETRRERKREIALLTMERAGLARVLEADFSAHLRSSPLALTVVEEAAIPPEYWVMRAPELNRPKLLKALKGGAPVPGAVIAPSHPILAVRRV